MLSEVVGFDNVLPHYIGDVGQGVFVDHGTASGLGYGLDTDVSHYGRRGLKITSCVTLSSHQLLTVEALNSLLKIHLVLTSSLLSRGLAGTNLPLTQVPVMELKPNVKEFQQLSPRGWFQQPILTGQNLQELALIGDVS